MKKATLFMQLIINPERVLLPRQGYWSKTTEIIQQTIR